jgi:peptidoglycan/LPS O-acetylase OafA/YrhL
MSVTPGSARFPLLDSVRALAALTILFGHTVVTHSASNSGAVVSPDVARLGAGNVLEPYLAHRNVGVTIFFVLSGFLLYRPFVAAHAAGEPRPRTTAYAWRRLLRIVPAYWFALLGTALLLSFSYVLHPRGIAEYFGFLQIYQRDTYSGGIPVAWSLCIEVTFYAFIPLFAWLLRRAGTAPWLRTQVIGLVALASASFAYKLALLSGDGASHPLAVKFLPAYLDQFALGMGLAVLSVALTLRRSPTPRVIELIERFPVLPWVLAAAAYVSLAHIGLPAAGGPGRTTGVFLARHALFGLVGLGVLMPAVLGDPTHGFTRRILANRALLYLGLVSYAIYLWHPTVILLFARHHTLDGLGLPDVVVWPLAVFGVTTAIATLSYYAVERPALRMKRRLGGVPAPAPLEALADGAAAEMLPADAPA